MVTKVGITIAIAILCVVALILVIVLGSRSHDSCDSVGAPRSLSFTPLNNTIMVSWFGPEEAGTCNVTYQIHHSVDNGVETRNVTNGLYIEFPRLNICSILNVSIQAISPSGRFSIGITSKYTELPTEIAAVTNTTFTMTEEQLVLSWTLGEDYANCNASYSVLLITDLGVYLDVTDTESYNISDIAYCFDILASVSVVIGEVHGDAATDIFLDEFEAPQNLALTRSLETNQLNATWLRHTKELQCEIIYFAMYQVENDAAMAIPTTNGSVSFDIAYCANATVEITAASRLTSRFAVATEHHEEGYPVHVGEVTLIVIEVATSGTSANVSWEPSYFSRHCNSIQYTVNSVTTGTSGSSCSGERSCQINSSTFCPSTNFTITPTTLSGASATYTRICS